MLALTILPASAAGLVAHTLHALGEFRAAVRTSIAVLGLNVLLDFALVRGMGMDAGGLALSTAICAWLNLLRLLPALSRRAGCGRSSVVLGAEPFRCSCASRWPGCSTPCSASSCA